MYVIIIDFICPKCCMYLLIYDIDLLGGVGASSCPSWDICVLGVW